MNEPSETCGSQRTNPAASEHSSFRASHADRDQTAARLRHAAGEGRLLTDELERRLEAAFTARTYGELDLLIRDLPTERGPDRRQRLAELIPIPITAAIALAAAALVTLALIAAIAGFGRSGAAASDQPNPRIGLNAAGP